MGDVKPTVGLTDRHRFGQMVGANGSAEIPKSVQ